MSLHEIIAIAIKSAMGLAFTHLFKLVLAGLKNSPPQALPTLDARIWHEIDTVVRYSTLIVCFFFAAVIVTHVYEQPSLITVLMGTGALICLSGYYYCITRVHNSGLQDC